MIVVRGPYALYSAVAVLHPVDHNLTARIAICMRQR